MYKPKEIEDKILDFSKGEKGFWQSKIRKRKRKLLFSTSSIAN